MLFALNLTNLRVKTILKQQTDGYRYKHLFPLNYLNTQKATFHLHIFSMKMFTFLLEGSESLWTLGLFLDSKIHIVLLHVEVDGGS